MGKITLITGGVRSGKSRIALELALQKPSPRAFLATAIAFDDEMKLRIENHKIERIDQFTTVEEPYDIANALNKIDIQPTVIVMDCVTVWLGNLFYKYENNEQMIKKTIIEFVNLLSTLKADILLVTNEVGWGIVPENALARAYRDMAGWANQKLAQVANEVLLVVCGICQIIKEDKNQGQEKDE